MKICKVCATEKKIRTGHDWTAIGKCEICGERHILFEAKDK